ncbi:hypothetical protein M408DRAFT_326475 [Serendipita vermifera MAFF 305830]|uniref:Nuclear pore protein n=1 Tax=Serendipita vermifera MAFF 305830 TaxID=933852 RepID=A0A0C3BMS3_SERVB|nr:hypothetical protein M408DRAFT_326475 [Serendipita vermifera MAFF 305830]
MDLSTLLSESQALTAHLAPNDIPSIHLGLEQIEAQSRRLVSRQAAAAPGDTGKASYLLAQAQVDAGTLANNIAALNTATTFAPLQPLHDTDVAGFLRHAHEQSIISTIEEGRRETLLEFRRVLDERVRRDWEGRKKKIFEELGERSTLLAPDARKGSRGVTSKGVLQASTTADQQQARMMAYDSTITSFNTARLSGVAYPILRSLMDQTDPASMTHQTYQFLASIVDESPALPSAEHMGAQVSTVGTSERKYAKAYLGDPDSREAIQLRRQIAAGAQRSLETQYWEVITRTIAARPQQAALGGDPSVAAHVKAYLNVKFYQQGGWEERLELIAGQPLWAKMFYLIRTGHLEECLQEALLHENAISMKERHFVTYLKAWITSPTHSLTRSERNPLQAAYNSHILHSPTTDPFKLALFKIIGKLDPARRAVPLVTSTTEDWLWFQLAMLDEEENGGLRHLGEALMGYGERHFEGTAKGKRGMWARAIAALYEVPELQVDAVHFAVALAYYGLLRVPSKAESSDVDIMSTTSTGLPALNFALLISRYIRQFIRIEPQIALQYVYCLCLSADQVPAGKEQVEIAWELTRRVILMAELSGGWADLVGGYRADGTRFTGVIERDLKLLKLDSNPTDFAEHILKRAARQSEREKRINEAIRLYHLAGEHQTVVECLARALGDQVSEPTGGASGQGPDEGEELANTAKEVLGHYERTNRASGKAREAVVKLVRIRDARVAKEQGLPERALEIMESTGIFPTENDVTIINKKAQQLRDYDEVIVRNMQVFLPLQMDILVELRNRRRTAMDASAQNAGRILTEKALALQKFATSIKYSMSPDVHMYLSRSVVDLMH